MRKRPATRPEWWVKWWARKLSSLRGPAPLRRPAAGAASDGPTAGRGLRWMHRIPISRSARATIGPRPMHILDAYAIPGRAPPTATRRRRSMGHGWTVPRHMRGRRTTWLSNGIESVVYNHVRPVRYVVRVWCDQSDVVGSRRPGRPARALRIPAAHRVVQVAARASHAASKSCISPLYAIRKPHGYHFPRRSDRPWSKSTCSV